jgi:hypothetical protein
MSKVGRPKVPKNKAFVPGVSVRLTADDRKTIDAAIQQSGLTQSEWARKALIYVAGQRIKLT